MRSVVNTHPGSLFYLNKPEVVALPLAPETKWMQWDYLQGHSQKDSGLLHCLGLEQPLLMH
jgi:hypothetical protein